MIKMPKTKIRVNLEQELIEDFEFYVMIGSALRYIRVKEILPDVVKYLPLHEEYKTLDDMLGIKGVLSPQLYNVVKNFTSGLLTESEVAPFVMDWYNAYLSKFGSKLSRVLSSSQQSEEKAIGYIRLTQRLLQISLQPVDYFAEALKKVKPQLTSLIQKYEKDVMSI